MPCSLVKRSELGLAQQLAAELDALAQVLGRKQLHQVLDRLHAQEHAGAGVLDLELLLGEQQEHRVDHEVGGLQRLDRGAVLGERGGAHRPLAGVAAEVVRLARQAQVEGGGPELLDCAQERVGVLDSLIALGQDGDDLALLESAQLELPAQRSLKVFPPRPIIGTPPQSGRMGFNGSQIRYFVGAQGAAKWAGNRRLTQHHILYIIAADYPRNASARDRQRPRGRQWTTPSEFTDRRQSGMSQPTRSGASRPAASTTSPRATAIQIRATWPGPCSGRSSASATWCSARWASPSASAGGARSPRSPWACILGSLIFVGVSMQSPQDRHQQRGLQRRVLRRHRPLPGLADQPVHRAVVLRHPRVDVGPDDHRGLPPHLRQRHRQRARCRSRWRWCA